MKDLKTRAISAIIFAVIVISAIFINIYTITILFAAITMICLWEYYQMLLQNYKPKPLIYAAMLLGLSIFLQPTLFIKAYAIPMWYFNLAAMLVLLLVEMILSKELNVVNGLKLIMGLILIAYPLSIVNELTTIEGEFVPWKIMSILILIWISDMGQYFSGRFLGKHLLAERLSPKKTWEGFLGGMIFTLLGSYILSRFFTFYTLENWLIIGAIISLFGSLGDLYESMLKRSVVVKDSGTIMPGHGGMYDRFDAFIFALPFLYFYIKIFIS